MPGTAPVENLRITLRENGQHSFWKALEAFTQYEQSHDQMLLKDAIIFLHHGVELLMKEILAGTSQFLIFEDLKDATKKQKQAESKKTGIFFLSNPPRTVTFTDAISRVDAFVKPPELTIPLIQDLERLNSYRNQLEHYAIEADVAQIVNLLASLREPLLTLFEARLGPMKSSEPPLARRAWEVIKRVRASERQVAEKVHSAMRLFDYQSVPGRVFSMPGDVTLPRFNEVLFEGRIQSGGRVMVADVLGKQDGHDWIVEIRVLGTAKNPLNLLRDLSYRTHSLGGQVWIVFSDSPPQIIREQAFKLGYFVSGPKELDELLEILSPPKAGST